MKDKNIVLFKTSILNYAVVPSCYVVRYNFLFVVISWYLNLGKCNNAKNTKSYAFELTDQFFF